MTYLKSVKSWEFGSYDVLDSFLVFPAHSTHTVVACLVRGFVDVLIDVDSRDGVFLNGAYCTFC